MASLLNLPITTAITATQTPIFQFRNGRPPAIVLQGIFTFGSGTLTTADAYVQTSLDLGVTWYDIANFHYTTASANLMFSLSALTAVPTQSSTRTLGTMANNTALDGFFGNLLRVTYVTTGTYAGNTLLRIDIGAVGEGELP